MVLFLNHLLIVYVAVILKSYICGHYLGEHYYFKCIYIIFWYFKFKLIYFNLKEGLGHLSEEVCLFSLNSMYILLLKLLLLLR